MPPERYQQLRQLGAHYKLKQTEADDGMPYFWCKIELINWMYQLYQQAPLLTTPQRKRLESALLERLEFQQAFQRLAGAVCLYSLFKVQVTCKPTLKRLAALRLLHLQDRGLLQLQNAHLPLTLRQEVLHLHRYAWTLKAFHSICSSFDFFPPLKAPEDAVGKQMVLSSSRGGILWSFRSITPGWPVSMTLYSLFTIFQLRRGDVRRLKILFLEVVHGSLDEYIFDFHHVDEQLDYSRLFK